MLCGWLNRVELCSLGANKQTKVARENKQTQLGAGRFPPPEAARATKEATKQAATTTG